MFCPTLISCSFVSSRRAEVVNKIPLSGQLDICRKALSFAAERFLPDLGFRVTADTLQMYQRAKRSKVKVTA